MKLRSLIVILAAGSTLFVAACGGSESSTRQRNSAPCYADYDEQTAAIAAAQAAYDAAISSESASTEENDASSPSPVQQQAQLDLTNAITLPLCETTDSLAADETAPSNLDLQPGSVWCSVHVDGGGAQFNCPFDIVTTFQFGSRSEQGDGLTNYAISFMNPGDYFDVKAVGAEDGVVYAAFRYESGGTVPGDMSFTVPESLEADSQVDLVECSVHVDGGGAQFNCPFDIVTTFQFGSRSEEGDGSSRFAIDFMNPGDKFRVSALSIDRGTPYFEFEYESGGTDPADVAFNIPSSLDGGGGQQEEAQQSTCSGVVLEPNLYETLLRVTGCSDSLLTLSLAGLGPDTLEMSETFEIEFAPLVLPSGWVELIYEATFSDGTETSNFEYCWTLCDESLPLLAYSPENPTVGDTIWFATDTRECGATDWMWHAFHSDGTLYAVSMFHQPFRPSQSEKYTVRGTGYCTDGTEVQAQVDIEPLAVDAPTNDNMVDAHRIEGEAGTVAGTTFGATREVGEPLHNFGQWESDTTAWLVWTAPENGVLTTSTDGSEMVFTTVAVYARESMQRLNDIDGEEGGSSWSEQHFGVVKNTEYVVAINNLFKSDFGDYVFNWDLSLEGNGSAASDELTDTRAVAVVVDVAAITTSESGVTTMVIPENTDVLIFSESDLTVLRDMAGAVTGEILVQLDDGKVFPLNKLGSTKLHLGDSQNLQVIVPGSGSQPVVVQLQRTGGVPSTSGTSTTSKTGDSTGMSPLTKILLILALLGVVVGAIVQNRRSALKP